MSTSTEGCAVRWGAQCRGGLDELDAARAHQEQALRLAEEAGDTTLQARTGIALSANYRGELVLVG
jgi:hypothetical protein